MPNQEKKGSERGKGGCHYGCVSWKTGGEGSDADPWHFGVDPDPEIHASD